MSLPYSISSLDRSPCSQIRNSAGLRFAKTNLVIPDPLVIQQRLMGKGCLTASLPKDEPWLKFLTRVWLAVPMLSSAWCPFSRSHIKRGDKLLLLIWQWKRPEIWSTCVTEIVAMSVRGASLTETFESSTRCFVYRNAGLENKRGTCVDTSNSALLRQPACKNLSKHKNRRSEE